MQGSMGEAMPNTSEDALVCGCLFCLTGKERQTAESIARTDIRAIVARQAKFKTVNGKKQIIFDEDADPNKLRVAVDADTVGFGVLYFSAFFHENRRFF